MNTKFQNFFLLIANASFNCVVAHAEPISLEQILAAAEASAPLAKVWTLEGEAAEKEISSRDLVLSPVLNADASLARDGRESLGRTQTTQGNVSSIDASVVVPFSTGTTATLNATHERAQSEDISGNHDLAGWEAKLSQSLLRDGFGRSTRLRRESDRFDLQLKRLGIVQERQSYIADVETAYWELLEAQVQQSVYKKNLERRQALETWTKRRIDQFAAEGQDLVQVQTLVNQLRISLASVENDIASAYERIESLIPGLDPRKWTLDPKDLEVDRKAESLVASATATAASTAPVRIEAAVASLKAKMARSESLLVEDSLRPDLSPYISYGANAAEPQTSKSFGEAIKARHSAARVGISLSMNLDAGIRNDKAAASRAFAESQALRSDAMLRDSELSWNELKRKISFLKMQVKAAKELSKLQDRKVAIERARFQKGQTTTLQMTTYEVDAADSELRVYQMLGDLRKTEALARTFMVKEAAQL